MCSTVQSAPGATRPEAALTDTRPVWQLTDDEVETALVDLERSEARLVAVRAALVREADLRGLQQRTQALSVEGWLRDRFRLSAPEAKRRTATAELLLGQPVVHDALAGGHLTPEQASVVATALDAVDSLEQVPSRERQAAAEFLFHQSTALAPRALATAAAALVERLTRSPSTDDPADEEAVARELAAAEAAARLADTNSLTIRRRPDGSVTGRFSIRPTDASVLTPWLKQADAPHPGTDGFDDIRPREQRRGDHLITTLRDALTTSSERPSARVHVHVNVTTTLHTLQAAATGAGLLHTGGTLSAAELRRLACDAGITPIVLGGPSEILDLGRTRRTFTLAQRRALDTRDRGCTAPGCDRAPADCDGHHQTEWAKGGATDLANAALLCPYHHQQVHRQGWKVTLAANGCPQFTPPASIDPDRRPRQHHRYRLTLLAGRHRT
ncbi:MAG: DUF222 domain-containing protein [Sporichthyaceae bacterium]